MRGLLGRARIWSASRRVVLLLALTVLSLTAVACKAVPESKPEAPRDPYVASLKWNPEDLAAARPGLVAWRYANDAHGVLVALGPNGETTVLWEAPYTQTLVQLEDIAPDASQMLARVTKDLYDSSTVSHVVFRPDGTARTLPLPEGFEGLWESGFMGEDVLVLANHVTPEDLKTTLGVVGTDGAWRDLTIEGDVPSYQIIDTFVVLPGTDVVGLVLKTGGGTSNRDDDVLVLARREGTTLRVFTPPYGEDSLPLSAPLWDAQGVAFPRIWNEDMSSDATVFVRAEWTGSEWVEKVIAPTTFASIIDRGGVMAESPEGEFWLRSAAVGGHDTPSTLLHTTVGSTTPTETGIDATNIEWFCWIDAAK